jgi:predicted DNA-binding transcriptional regulator AlpA
MEEATVANAIRAAAHRPAQRGRFCSVAHAAQLFDVSEMTLYRAIRIGRFPAIRIMGRLVVPLKAIDAMEQAASERNALVDAAEWVERQLGEEQDRPRQYGAGSFSTQHSAGYGEDATPADREAGLGGGR